MPPCPIQGGVSVPATTSPYSVLSLQPTFSDCEIPLSSSFLSSELCPVREALRLTRVFLPLKTRNMHTDMTMRHALGRLPATMLTAPVKKGHVPLRKLCRCAQPPVRLHTTQGPWPHTVGVGGMSQFHHASSVDASRINIS